MTTPKRGWIKPGGIVEMEDVPRLLDETRQQAKQEVLEEVRGMIPEERTEGILGILGSRHADGVRNEGFNEARQQMLDSLNEIDKSTLNK